MQITNNSLYDTSLVWIEKINHPVEPKGGTRLTSVYQLQPFELALKDTVRIGIRYNNQIKDMKNIIVIVKAATYQKEIEEQLKYFRSQFDGKLQ